MFVFTLQGLAICTFSLVGTLLVVYISERKGLTSISDKVLFLLFHLAVASSVWGLAAPKIGNSITTFRLSLLFFFFFYIYIQIKKKINLFQGMQLYHWILWILFSFMILYGLVTVIFLSANRSYTFSRLLNLCFDLLFCMAIVLYTRKQCRIFKSLMINLTVTLGFQFLVSIYECFAGPVYTDTHLGSVGPGFFGLFNFHLPSVSTFNTNDLSASLFFMGMPVIVFWANKLLSRSSKRMSSAIIMAIFTAQWFVSYCGGAIIVQIGVLLFFAVISLFVVWWTYKEKNGIALMIIVVPIIVAVVLQISPFFSLNSRKGAVSSGSSAASSFTAVSPSNFLFEETFESVASSSSSSQVDFPKAMEQEKPDVQVGKVEGFSGWGVGSDEVMKKTVNIRITLLKFAFNTFIDNPLGVGLGNTQKLAEKNIASQTNGISKLHCYGAECIADFGFVFLTLGVLFVISLLNQARKAVKNIIKTGEPSKLWLVVLSIVMLPSAVFLSTAPGCAQDLMAMWMFLAIFIVMIEQISNMANTNEVF